MNTPRKRLGYRPLGVASVRVSAEVGLAAPSPMLSDGYEAHGDELVVKGPRVAFDHRVAVLQSSARAGVPLHHVPHVLLGVPDAERRECVQRPKSNGGEGLIGVVANLDLDRLAPLGESEGLGESKPCERHSDHRALGVLVAEVKVRTSEGREGSPLTIEPHAHVP